MAALSVDERAELNKLFISLEYARKPILFRLLSRFKRNLAFLSGKKAVKITKSKICHLVKFSKKAS